MAGERGQDRADRLVALAAAPRQMLDLDVLAQPVGDEPEGRLTEVGLDREGLALGQAVALRAGDAPAAVGAHGGIEVDTQAEAAEHVEGQADIVQRRQRRRQLQRRVAVEQGQGHQQARDELRGLVARDAVVAGLDAARQLQRQAAPRLGLGPAQRL